MFTDDLLGVIVSEFFNRHAPFRGSDHHRFANFAIDDNRQVQFASNIQPLLDIQGINLFAFFTGLDGDQS